jgi:cellulose synthase/poly-beta-1,6-N-acetylglucosamine synthase-like glycosyltransferase/peptidoglycan/xylan/chitin deacetylase (PgdA/CDA1 family)
MNIDSPEPFDASLASPSSGAPIFHDPAGRRWRRWKRVPVAAGVVTSLLALVLLVSVLAPPFLPQLPLQETPAAARRPPLLTSRGARERLAFRRRLAASLRRHPAPPARRPQLIPALAGRTTPIATPRPGASIVAGFFVNWADNSLASLIAHGTELDWVICEWAFLEPSGDSLTLAVNPKVFDAVRALPEGSRPQIFAMVSNFSSRRRTFSPEGLRTMLRTAASRARVIGSLASAADRYALAGITIDFEEVSPDLDTAVIAFARELRRTLAPAGRLVTATVHANAEAPYPQRLAAECDYLLPMLFDEHYQGGDPGPVASQAFYAARARAMVAIVPRDKLILMIGAYGYQWNEGDSTAATMTFQETMAAARDSAGVLRFDPVSLNPYLTWSDPDSTDHLVWFLDGATAWNAVQVGDSLGVAGQAIWRLGDEDPSLWAALGRRGRTATPDSLHAIPPGYDTEFRGEGEILRMIARPTEGARTVRADDATGLIIDERIGPYPTPYIVERFGASDHRVALTFDDGPDGRWTPPILDTLRSRAAPATFFVIGNNVDRHLALTRRIFREGHEIGNHTYTHPNLALTTTHRTQLELDAAERMIEAVLDHRTALFRPPYFGDAAPTTTDELDPVSIASDRGYYTIGLRIDSQDWQPLSVDQVVGNVMAQRDSGNVVLLHDGGGDRATTVAALGIIIDSLRARGDTLVLVSELAGITRGEAMPPLAALSEMRRMMELGGFALLGSVEWLLYWVFMTAVVLGIARLVVVATLAAIQRLRRHQVRGDPVTFTPPVSVIVPAYNEEKVITRTVQSLLAQDYAGPLQIVVVDDGSTDATCAVARNAFAGNPAVTVITRPNGGKAVALNHGLAVAVHEIVIALDADTLFARDTVAELVRPLADPRVGAVAGNAKVGNRVNLVTRWQALEYVTSQNLDRRAFSLLDGITVVPGAVGAWRRTLVRQVGGFSSDTLAEDQDLTLAVRRAGYSVAFADGAIGYTEAPDSLGALARQRFRWSFGTLQCAWKHRDALGRPRFGALGLVALPNTWLFQLLLPALSPIADLMFAWSLLSIWLARQDHGSTYALTSLEQVMTYYAVFLLVDWVASIVAFLMEPAEDRSLTWLIVLQRFAYRQVMYWVVVRAFATAFTGRWVGWGKLERKATVQLPA